MDDTKTQGGASPLGNTAPLGKSVEDVEREGGNLVNPTTPREVIAEAPLPTIPVLGGPSETPLVAGNPADGVVNRQEGTDTTRPDGGQGDDGSENGEA